MVKRAPVETKVHAATTGGGAGGIVAAALVWVLGAFVWGGPNDADHAARAVAAVPAPIVALVLLVVPAFGAFLGGFYAHHAPRKEDAGAGVVEVLTVLALVLVILAALVYLHANVHLNG